MRASWMERLAAASALAVRRVKNGTPATHTLQGDELRALRRLKRESPAYSDFVFQAERGGPFTETGFAFMVSRTGAKAVLPFKTHPHMLRHACGYKLANDDHDTRAIQAWLGHRSIGNTVKYTELSATRFSNFWRRGGRPRCRAIRPVPASTGCSIGASFGSTRAGETNPAHVASLFKARWKMSRHIGCFGAAGMRRPEVVMHDTLIVIGALIAIASYLAVVVLVVWFRPWTVLWFVLGQELPDASDALVNKENLPE